MFISSTTTIPELKFGKAVSLFTFSTLAITTLFSFFFIIVYSLKLTKSPFEIVPHFSLKAWNICWESCVTICRIFFSSFKYSTYPNFWGSPIHSLVSLLCMQRGIYLASVTFVLFQEKQLVWICFSSLSTWHFTLKTEPNIAFVKKGNRFTFTWNITSTPFVRVQ